MTFCNITVLRLTELVANLLLLQLVSADDFFFFLKKIIVKEKFKYFNDGGDELGGVTVLTLPAPLRYCAE